MSELEIGDKVQTGKDIGLTSLLMTLLICDDCDAIFYYFQRMRVIMSQVVYLSWL